MFDPYREWLGLPPGPRPPTYYQLLGIRAEEDDAERIKEAALRQTARVRVHQTGPHARECTELLNELAQALTTLLNPVRRKAYDAQRSQPRLGIPDSRPHPGPEPGQPSPPGTPALFSGPLSVPDAHDWERAATEAAARSQPRVRDAPLPVAPPPPVAHPATPAPPAAPAEVNVFAEALNPSVADAEPQQPPRYRRRQGFRPTRRDCLAFLLGGAVALLAQTAGWYALEWLHEQSRETSPAQPAPKGTPDGKPSRPRESPPTGKLPKPR
jgi:hypothetical protein